MIILNIIIFILSGLLIFMIGLYVGVHIAEVKYTEEYRYKEKLYEPFNKRLL